MQGASASTFSFAGLLPVYLAGGVPAAWRAAVACWEERVLDIDLLMVVAGRHCNVLWIRQRHWTIDTSFA